MVLRAIGASVIIAFMHPRTEELLDLLDINHAELRRAVDDIPPHLRERRPGPGCWSVADVLQHVGLVEMRLTQLLTRKLAAAMVNGLGTETSTSSVLDGAHIARVLDRTRRVTAGDSVQPVEGIDSTMAMRTLEEARAAFRAFVASGDGLALGEIVHPHPVLGPLDVYRWIVFVATHEARHTAQIREVSTELVQSLHESSPVHGFPQSRVPSSRDLPP